MLSDAPDETVPHHAPRSLFFLSLACCLSGAVSAQETTVIQENVRIDYARVLNVEPVYQTLRATRMEHHCEEAEQAKGLAKIVGAVKGALTPGPEEKPEPQPGDDCRLVPVEREFKRPIGYDVDYVYKGAKFRSRLPNDPGSRLRVRVSVMPYVPAANLSGR